MIDRAAVTGVILCGGEGRRMGGREKPLALAGGISLVSQLRARLDPQVGRIIISANRQLEVYAGWGDTVVVDERPGLGPLGGLLSALAHVESPYTLCCPGDAPLLPNTLVARLAEVLDRAVVDLVTVDDGVQHQPLFLLLKTERRASLREFVHCGGRAVREWVAAERNARLDASNDRDSFFNVNTDVDLVRLEAMLASVGYPSSQPVEHL